MTAIMRSSPAVFNIVKIIGLIYLVWLGLKAILAARHDSGEIVTSLNEANPIGPLAAFRHGLLCNLLNPKAAVFFLALMPQFIGTEPRQDDILGSAFAAFTVTAMWFLVIANVAGWLRRVLIRPHVRKVLNTVTGGVLILLGLRVAFTA